MLAELHLAQVLLRLEHGEEALLPGLEGRARGPELIARRRQQPVAVEEPSTRSASATCRALVATATRTSSSRPPRSLRARSSSARASSSAARRRPSWSGTFSSRPTKGRSSGTSQSPS